MELQNNIEHYKNLSLDDIPGEKWLPIIGYEEHYAASSLGRIKRLSREKMFNYGKGIWPGRIMKPCLDKNGYLLYTLCKDGKPTIKRSTTIIASAFLKKEENQNQVNHKNGIKTDNRVENLEWCTGKQNINHAFANGLVPIRVGEARSSSKLKNKDVLAIKLMIKEKVPTKEIIKKFPVSYTQLHKIRNEKTWKHIVV